MDALRALLATIVLFVLSFFVMWLATYTIWGIAVLLALYFLIIFLAIYFMFN